MDILARLNRIELGSSSKEVKQEISNLFLGYDVDEDGTIETERLDHIFEDACKRVSFTFKDDALIDIDEIY